MFVLPVFIIGGFIALFVVFCLQNMFKSISYFTSLTVFIFLGMICNIFALGHLIKNGWDEGVLQYLILGIVDSLLYFHMGLLLNKVTTLIKAKLSLKALKYDKDIK